MADNNSPRFSLNVADVVDITKNTALVALAAGPDAIQCLPWTR